MASNTVIAFAWMFHFIFFVSIGLAFAHAARERSGSVLRWPVGLRWVFSALFFLLAFMALDVFLIRKLGGGILGSGTSWKVAVIRLIPIPFEGWILYRMLTKGLSLDKWEKENG